MNKTCASRSLTETGQSASNLIATDLAAGEKYGYQFTLTGAPTRLHDHGGAIGIPPDRANRPNCELYCTCAVLNADSDDSEIGN